MTTPELTPTPVNPVWLPQGTRVGAYIIRRALGRGGGQMAYLAEGPRKRRVVLKMSIYPKGERDSESRMMHQRFLRQVAFFLELDGVPGVAKVSAYGMYPDTSHDGHLYMVQEWVPKSRTIVDWSSEAPRPLNIIVCGWVMLAAACGEMARRGICHRDLTADNVLMTPRGVPKVIDINSGIGPGAERLTWPSSRCVPGTPSSYSPEHCEAILQEYATRRPLPFQYLPTGDLHALGVIFYEVLTGQHPFRHARGEELYRSIAHRMPERPRVLNPEVPFGLEKVTMKLLQKKPEQRYQSGDAVALDLEALFATGEDWGRPFQTPRSSRDPASSGTTPEPPASGARPHGPTVDGTSALALPPAVVRAGPEAIVVLAPFSAPSRRAPLGTVRLLPGATVDAPVIHLGERRPRRRWASLTMASWPTRRLAAALLVVTVAAATVLVSTGLLGRVRADDEAWLATCSPAARKTVRDLGIAPEPADAWLEDGPSVIMHDAFAELRDGPFEAVVSATGVVGILAGDIHVGSDGASLRFTRLKLDGGQVLPICGWGADWRAPGRPGLDKVELPPFPPESELHEGYLLVPTGRLVVQFAR
jgi:eukaryotic-like serine/threonine-protein kinase